MQSSEPTAQPGGRRRGLGAVRMCARGGGIAGRLAPLSAVLPADATGSAAVPAGQRHRAPDRLPAAFPAMLCAVAPWWSCSPPHTRAKKRATQARSPGLAAAHNGASTSSAWASREFSAGGPHGSPSICIWAARQFPPCLELCQAPSGGPGSRCNLHSAKWLPTCAPVLLWTVRFARRPSSGACSIQSCAGCAARFGQSARRRC